MKRHPHPNPGLQILAFMLTIAAGLVVLFVPLMAEVKVSNDEPERIRYVTLLSVMGWSIFLPLLVPVALAGLPLLLAGRMRKWASVATAIGLALPSSARRVSAGSIFRRRWSRSWHSSRPPEDVKPRRLIRRRAANRERSRTTIFMSSPCNALRSSWTARSVPAA